MASRSGHFNRCLKKHWTMDKVQKQDSSKFLAVVDISGGLFLSL
jgi:hypothetical protein